MRDRLQELGRIDRRWIYLTLAASLAVTIVIRPLFPDKLSPLTQPVFTYVESLEPGSPVLVALDYSPSSAPELEPMALALTRHLLLRGARPVFVSLWPDGNILFQTVRAEVIDAEFADLEEGRDWVVLGYKAGDRMVINALRQDLGAMYTTDLRDVPLASLPALDGVSALSDFRLIVGLSAGTPGLQEWILYGGDPTGTPVAGGCSGIGVPEFLVYYPGQLVGLLGGLKGASEYEAGLAAAYPDREFPRRAGLAMGPQTVAHVLILVFLILGNLAYLRRLGRLRPGGRSR